MVVKSNTVTQAAKYLVVGGICTIVDIGLLYILTEYVGIYYVLAAALSFTMGVTLNYFMCTGWIFEESKIKNKGIEILFYLIISIIGLLINVFVIWLLTNFVALHFMLSKFLATALTLIWNFCSRKYLLHI